MPLMLAFLNCRGRRLGCDAKPVSTPICAMRPPGAIAEMDRLYVSGPLRIRR